MGNGKQKVFISFWEDVEPWAEDIQVGVTISSFGKVADPGHSMYTCFNHMETYEATGKYHNCRRWVGSVNKGGAWQMFIGDEERWYDKIASTKAAFVLEHFNLTLGSQVEGTVSWDQEGKIPTFTRS